MLQTKAFNFFKRSFIFYSKAILNRCIQSTANTGQDESVFSKTGLKNFFQEVSEDLHMCSWEIVYLCIIAFGNYFQYKLKID